MKMSMSKMGLNKGIIRTSSHFSQTEGCIIFTFGSNFYYAFTEIYEK